MQACTSGEGPSQRKALHKKNMTVVGTRVRKEVAGKVCMGTIVACDKGVHVVQFENGTFELLDDAVVAKLLQVPEKDASSPGQQDSANSLSDLHNQMEKLQLTDPDTTSCSGKQPHGSGLEEEDNGTCTPKPSKDQGSEVTAEVQTIHDQVPTVNSTKSSPQRSHEVLGSVSTDIVSTKCPESSVQQPSEDVRGRLAKHHLELHDTKEHDSRSSVNSIRSICQPQDNLKNETVAKSTAFERTTGQKIYRIVLQICPYTGKVVAEHKGPYAAIKSLGRDSRSGHSIYRNLNGKRRNAYSFVWRYKDTIEDVNNALLQPSKQTTSTAKNAVTAPTGAPSTPTCGEKPSADVRDQYLNGATVNLKGGRETQNLTAPQWNGYGWPNNHGTDGRTPQHSVSQQAHGVAGSTSAPYWTPWQYQAAWAHHRQLNSNQLTNQASATPFRQNPVIPSPF